MNSDEMVSCRDRQMLFSSGYDLHIGWLSAPNEKKSIVQKEESGAESNVSRIQENERVQKNGSANPFDDPITGNKEATGCRRPCYKSEVDIPKSQRPGLGAEKGSVAEWRELTIR